MLSKSFLSLLLLVSSQVFWQIALPSANAVASTNGPGSNINIGGGIGSSSQGSGNNPAPEQGPSGSLDMTGTFLQQWLIPTARSLQSTATQNLRSHLSSPEQASCERAYRRVLSNRRMEVNLSFGYMDVSEGQDYVYDGVAYPNSTSIDIFGRRSFYRLLTADCRGSLGACGFSTMHGDRDTLTKTITGPSGEAIEVIVRMKNGSVSPIYEDNETSLAAEQAEQTQIAEENFFGSVKSADALIYMGHSRNGGGPDFNPPVLMANGHPNYTGYYMPRQPGFNRLLSELRAPGENPMLIAILSCLSESHFGRRLGQVAPETGFVYTGAPVLAEYSQIVSAGFATLDGLVRMQCGSGFSRELDVAVTDSPRVFMRQFLGTEAVGARSTPIEPSTIGQAEK